MPEDVGELELDEPDAVAPWRPRSARGRPAARSPIEPPYLRLGAAPTPGLPGPACATGTKPASRGGRDRPSLRGQAVPRTSGMPRSARLLLVLIAQSARRSPGPAGGPDRQIPARGRLEVADPVREGVAVDPQRRGRLADARRGRAPPAASRAAPARSAGRPRAAARAGRRPGPGRRAGCPARRAAGRRASGPRGPRGAAPPGARPPRASRAPPPPGAGRPAGLVERARHRDRAPRKLARPGRRSPMPGRVAGLERGDRPQLEALAGPAEGQPPRREPEAQLAPRSSRPAGRRRRGSGWRATSTTHGGPSAGQRVAAARPRPGPAGPAPRAPARATSSGAIRSAATASRSAAGRSPSSTSQPAGPGSPGGAGQRRRGGPSPGPGEVGGDGGRRAGDVGRRMHGEGVRPPTLDRDRPAAGTRRSRRRGRRGRGRPSPAARGRASSTAAWRSSSPRRSTR